MKIRANSILRAGCFCAALLTGGFAHADTPVGITVNGGGVLANYSNVHQADAGTGSVYTGGFSVDITSVDGQPVDISSHATFCTELGEHVSFTSYTTYKIVDLKYASAGTAGRAGTPSSSIPVGGIGEQSAANMRYLFDTYYVSENIAAWTAMEAQAFQLAVWEIGHDPENFSLSGGSFYLGVQPSQALIDTVALAQTMLTATQDVDVSPLYQSTRVKVWSLADTNGINATTGYQDLLFATVNGSPDGPIIVPLLPPQEPPAAVPEPSSMALIAMGAAGFLFQGRRRRTA